MHDFDSEDFDLPEDASPVPPVQHPEMDASKALITAALKGANTAPVRRALASAVPHVIVITTPTAAWARALSAEIGNAYGHAAVHAVTERKKDGNEWAVDTMLTRLASGKHLVFCTPDRQLLPKLVHAATDVELILPVLDAKLLQRAIRSFTGGLVRGMTEADFQGLDFPMLQLALRRGSRASDCLRRLRRSLEQGVLLRPGAMGHTGPALHELPLNADLSAWAHDLVDQLAAVAAGRTAPETLRYAVLAGAPGTGKTLVAGAIARSANWSFHSASLGEWFTTSDGNLGGVAKACSAFFDALLSGDCVVGFIDEIDSLPSRALLQARDLQWWTPIINLVLTQIDRLRNSGKRVLLLSATNYVERLDSALVRSGRLEQRLDFRVPDTETEVLAVFSHYLKDEIDLAELGGIERFALGATPATIAGWIRAARAIAHGEKRALTAHDVFMAVIPSDTRSPDEQKAVAVHEAGHAVVACVLKIGVESVSTMSQGLAGGMTRTSTPSIFPNLQEVEDLVTVLLAGRAADLVLGDKGAHAGAATDLEMATSLMVRGFYQWGLGDNLGPMHHPDKDAIAAIDKGLKRLLARAVRLIKSHRLAVETLTAALLEHRLLSGAQVKAIVEPLLGPAPDQALARGNKRPSRRPRLQLTNGGSSNDRLA